MTGGTGFLGSALCERLLEAENEVICIDNFCTGSKRNIAHLLSNPYFELVRHDITFSIYIEVDEKYTTSRARPLLSTTNTILSKRQK